MIFIKIYFLLNLLIVFYFLEFKEVKNDFKKMELIVFIKLYFVLITLLLLLGIFVFKKSKEGN